MRPGEEWGTPTGETPAASCAGTDADLAATVARHAVGAPVPPLVAFEPRGSDLARAVGLGTGPRLHGDGPRVALPLDALLVRTGRDPEQVAVNLVVSGRAPWRQRVGQRRRPVAVTVDGRLLDAGPALGVVVANGQFHDGLDVVPRGHPGDGRLEVHVYSPAPGERAPMRRRLATGSHVPHPRILTATGRTVAVTWDRAAPLLIDGVPAAPAATLEVAVWPGAYRLVL